VDVDCVVHRSAAQQFDAPAEDTLRGRGHVAHAAGVVECAQRLAHVVGHRAQVIARLAQLARGPYSRGGIDREADNAGGLAVDVVVDGEFVQVPG
jgi:hypothetical protein